MCIGIHRFRRATSWRSFRRWPADNSARGADCRGSRPLPPAAQPPLALQVVTVTAAADSSQGSGLERLRGRVPDLEIALAEPLVAEIQRLKRERGAVVLAHNYQVPTITYGVADFTGDSLELSRLAATVDSEFIVFCGVHFMAETAAILNPNRTVLIPDLQAGCSLAESITGADVRLLREAYPGVPVVTYVNSSAEVKAESDICCTSGNAARIVRSLGVSRVIFLPDEYLARNVAQETGVDVIAWHGKCIVHEQFTPEMIRAYRKQFPGVRVLAHPECAPAVCLEADFVGSTRQMIDDVDRSRARRVMMVTECSMSDNVQAAHPEVEFVKACTICPHMKRITLEGVRDSLRYLRYRVEVARDVAARARRAVEAMLAA
ncbi:MAG TPA: quinolinate synthase NadA [Gemmatimonadales bacterium]|nr:quinolinate synthase NadA [Gemmatimonadales bacterium]